MQEIMQFIGKHPILSTAWIALFATVIVMTIKSRFSKVKEITRAEATRLINKENALVVDTRSRDDFRKGHIVDACNIIISDIKSGNLGELEKHKAQPIIVVCANGFSAREAAEHLIKAGFEQVFTLKEGISGWQNDNLPLVRGK